MMLCLRCSRGLNALPISSIVPRTTRKVISNPPFKRTFASLPSLRPTIFPSQSSAFRPSLALSKSLPILPTSAGEAPLDLLPKISTHPALGTTQVRCGPRDTFSPSHFVRKRRHGFLSRVRTRKGRATLQRRRSKKRSTLSH